MMVKIQARMGWADHSLVGITVNPFRQLLIEMMDGFGSRRHRDALSIF
jgi:hypothetical protein